jgi:sulfur-carrier protein adenylyltransferase/sulfurtransferase
LAFCHHGSDTREHVVYDLRGEASQLSHGCLIETLAVAAAAQGLVLQVQRRSGTPDQRPVYDVRLDEGASLATGADAGLADLAALAPAIRQRSVQRKPMRGPVVSSAEQTSLAQGLDAGYEARWFTSGADRRACAALMFRNAHLRLTMPEAYAVHSSVIAWGQQTSTDRVPAGALGVDKLSQALMQRAMVSWQRVHFANRFLAGTWLPRLQMDWLPGVLSAGFCVLLAPREPQGLDDFVQAGRNVQRQWLAATRTGLWQQPQMTPLIFARYLRQGQRFTDDEAVAARAPRIAEGLQRLLGADTPRAVWMGRFGRGPAPVARSLRLPLEELLLPGPQNL